jgi:Bax protein
MLKFLRIVKIVIVVGTIILIYNFISDYKPSYTPREINVDEVVLLDHSLIIKQNSETVIPVEYQGKVNFASFDSEERKEKFIHFILPAIVIVRERLLDELHHCEFIEKRIKRKTPLSQDDFIFLEKMLQKYDAESLDELKVKLYPHPVSLVLAQAALESGWGTSRVFREGNNPFGIMSFSSDDSRVKNMLPDNVEDIYMRTYDRITESVEHYFMLTAKVSSYKKFRKRRWEGATSVELLENLKSYHENDDYNQLAKSIIKGNELTKYDLATVDPHYIKTRSLFYLLMKN